MYQHKRGDSFVLTGQIEETISGVSDFTGWTGESQIRTAGGELVEQLVFTWIDATQRICELKCLDTSAWPVGGLWMDIRLTSPTGWKVSTGKDQVFVVRGVTESA